MHIMSSELVEYLEAIMAERGLSHRALALYSGLSNSTVSRLMKGDAPNLETLNKLADYLRVDINDLYRMAGKARPIDEKRARVESVISDLYGKLPPEDQAEIIEIIKLKLGRHRQAQ